MLYKDHEITPNHTEIFDNGLTVKGWGIYRDGKFVSYAEDAALAKRYIDHHLRGEKKDGNQSKQKVSH